MCLNIHGALLGLKASQTATTHPTLQANNTSETGGGGREDQCGGLLMNDRLPDIGTGGEQSLRLMRGTRMRIRSFYRAKRK